MTSEPFAIPTHDRRRTSRTALPCLTMALALSLGACSGLTSPIVSVRPLNGQDGKPEAGLPSNPTFTQAKRIAENTVTDFNDKWQDLEAFDLATGTLLVGAGIAGLALGIYDAHPDAVYGAALAGGTAYAGRSFMPVAARKLAYRQGASAVTCVVSTIGLGESETATAPAGTGGVGAPAAALLGSGQAVSGPLRGAASALRGVANGQRSASFRAPAGQPGSATGNAVSGNGDAVSDLKARSTAVMSAVGASGNVGLTVAGTLAATRANEVAARALAVREAAGNLADQIDRAVASRGFRLLEATKTIVEAVNLRINGAAVTPDAALTAALAKVGSVNTSITEAAKTLKDDGKEAEANAAQAKETNAMAAGLAQGSRDTKSATELSATLAGIETAKEEAKTVQTQAAIVAALLGNAGVCISDLK